MTEEKTLLKISLIFSLIGLFILLLISEKLDLSQSNISSISTKNLDQNVRVKGYITKITETPGLFIIELQDNTASIPIIIFKSNEQLNLSKNQLIEVHGKVIEYKNKPEIQASEIKI